MNIRGVFDPRKKFQSAHGMPGYDEGNKEYVLGVDVLATQCVAYLAYAHIQELRGNEELARTYQKNTTDVRVLVNNAWWNEKEQCLYSRLNKDHKLKGREGKGLLYRDIVDDGPKLKSTINGRGSVEVMYRYGDPDTA